MKGERAWWRLLMAMAWLAVAACSLLLCTQPLLLCSLLRRFARFLCYLPRLFRLRKRRLRPPWRDLNRFIWTRRRNPLRIPRRRPLSLLPLCILVFAIRLSTSASQPPPSRDSDYIRRCIASAAIFTLCKIAVRWVWSCRGRRWRHRPLLFVCGFFGGTAFDHLPTTLRDLRHSRALALLLLLAMDVERHPGPDTQSRIIIAQPDNFTQQVTVGVASSNGDCYVKTAKGRFFTAGLRKNHVVLGVGPEAPSSTTAPSLDQVRSYLRLCEDTKSPATLHIRCSYPSASVAKPPPSQALQRTPSKNRKATGMRTARLFATPLAKAADANRKRAARLSTTPLAKEADSNRKRAARLSTTPPARDRNAGRMRAARLSTTPPARDRNAGRMRAARLSTTSPAREKNAGRMRAARLSTTPLAKQADANRKRTARQFTTASLRNREALRKAAARLSARLQLTAPHSYSVDAQRYRQSRTKHINIASCNHAIHNLVFAKMRWTTLKRLSLGGVDYQQWKIAAKRRANAKQHILMGMRGAGVGQRASGAAGGGGGFKAVPWSNKKTAAEKRKETAQGLHASRQNLVAFKALGPRAVLPHSHLTPEEHRQIVRNQCTLEVARVELDRRKKAALVRLRKHIAKLERPATRSVPRTGPRLSQTSRPSSLKDKHSIATAKKFLSPVALSPSTKADPAGAGGDGALEVGGEDVQGGDGEDPDVAAAEEGGQGGGAGKTDLYRLCDDNCSLPEGWPDKLLSILRRLTSSTYSSYLQLGKVVETLVALEHCEACESREGRDTSVLARVSGDGCHPVEQCTDALRWLRWIIAPHFTKVRTLLRQLYKFREDIHTLCKIEFYMDHGELEELLQVIGQSKGNSLPTASSSTLPPLSTVSEDTIQNTLGILFDKFHEEMKDMRNKQCDVCEERKSAGELQRAEAVAGRKRRRDDDEELDPQGSPLIDTRTDSRLLLPRPYLIFMGLEKCRICKPCFAKLRTTPGRVLKDGEAEEYHRFLTRVRQQSQRSGPPDANLPGVTGDFRLPHFPRLSIFNGCVLDPLPAPIKAVIAKGCFHTNMIKLVKAFFSVTYLRPAGNAGVGGMPALKGHSIYFPLSPSANTEYAQNICSLPSLTWETLILQGTKATKKQIFHALIAKEAVSAAIDWLINHNWDYRNVSNAWSASRLAEMTAEAMVSAGLEAEAADGDSEDEAEAAAPDDALYPRKRLRIRVVEDEDEEDGDSAPPQPPQPPNLNHLGSARILPLSASAQIQRSVAMAKTDIQVFENTRVEAEPLSAWDPKMESAPFPELYPTGRFGFNEGRPSWMNVNESEFARHQLNRLDPRFAESKEYLFAQTSRKVLRKVGSGVFFMTHTRSWSKSGTLPTVSDVLRDLQSVASDQLEGRIDSVLRSVPFSPGYWSIQRQRLEALVDYEGPPSVFLTLSNAEYEDKALISFLGSLPSHIDDLNDMSISSLTQLNPMAVSEHYTKKTKLILKLVVTNSLGRGHKREEDALDDFLHQMGMPEPLSSTPLWDPDVDMGEEGGGGKDDDDDVPLAFRGRGLLGHVSNFVIRREYQGRGKAHFHILLWTPECPTVKADMSEEEKKQVEDYVTSIASVTLPDPKQSPRLYELVRTFQTHACRSTCKTGRSVKRKKADGETTLQWIPVPCRYGFPKDPSPCFVLLDPDSAVKNMMKEGCTHELYLLHRGPDEIFINPFHPVILLLLGANMDIKVIRDWDGKIAYYLTKYVTKNDKAGKGSEVWEAARKLDPAASLTSKLYSVALSVLKTQELGQEAAADFLNSVPLFTLSATTSYLSVAPRAKRRHVLKGSKAQLEEMESSGRGGDCPVHLGFWDSTVPFRPRELEETCAWELQEHFERLSPAKYEERLQSYEARLQAAETAGRAPPDPLEAYRSLPTPDDRDFYLIRRKTPKITYTRTFRAETKEQGEETACCLLMLFKPYRDEDTLRGDHRSFVQALETEKPHLHRLHEWERRTTKRQKLGEALRQLRMEAEAELAADAESPEQAADGDIPQQSSLGAQRVPVGDELHSVVSSLNSDQHTVFCKVVDQLRHQRIHEAECRESLLPPAQQRCSWSLCSAHPRPLRQVVLGGAGTGKSHLIQAVTGQANRDALLPPALLVHPVGSAEDQALCDEQAEAVREALEQPLQDVARLTAPTGVAAWLIGGSTIHSTFRVPVITSRDSAPSAPELSGLALKTKKAEFRRTTIVIMDEVSMVSNAMLLFVSRQLSLITGKDDDWFGGMNMLLLGDLSQLQPVKAEGPYRPVIGDVYGTQVRREVDVWGQFHVHFLTQSMRAAEDPAFVSILTSVSQGNGSDDVLDALNARRIFLSHDGSQPTIDPKHPHFVQQCCPKETPVWKQEDYMSEAELCDAAARWAFEWEKANPGRELTVLAPRVDQCRQISSLALRLRGIPFTKILAQDELVRGFGGSKAEQTARKTKTPVDAKTEDTGGLEAELELGPGAKVMVRKNMDDSKGLVNGAVGTVTKLERSVDGRRVEFVHVKLKATGGEHKIGRVSVLFKAHKSSAQQFSRSQFPLISAYCITVHKSQGLTLDAVLADLGHLAAMDNLAYVALSRCRRLSDVFLLRLHPGIFRTDERCVSCLNEHRRLAGLPEQDECNASSLRFPGARQLVYGRRRRTTIAVSKVYAHHPDAAASNRSSSSRGRDNIGHQGRGRGRGRGFASTQSRVQTRNQNRGQSRGTSRGRSSRGRSGPSEGQVGVPAPRPTRPFLPPLPSHLQADGDWLVTTFSRPNSFRLQQEEFLPFVTSLQDAIALPTSPPRLQRVTAWLRTLPIATLDSLGPTTPPEDALAPTTFLYSCLHPLLRSISTNANGDCQFNSIWGSVCGTSSTWHARLLRGALVATICLHWDHFLALQALANDTTSQEYVEYFSRDIVAAVSAQSYVEDSLLYPLSYLLAREIHLYQRCERTGLNGVPSPAPVTPTLPELAAALTDRSLMKIIRFSSLPFPPTRRPILTLFNGLNHYATLLPRSLVLESQLPQPVLYLNDIPTIALFQAAHPLPPPDWDSLLLPQAPVPLLPAPPGAQQVPRRPPPATPSGPLPNLGPPPPIYTWPTWSQLYSVPKSTRPQRPVDLQLNNRLFLCTGDLRTLPVDAIVNAANTTLAGGGGIDGLIHTAAGPQLLKACLALHGCKTGQSKSTRGFRLPATHVIHTVGPDCRNMSLAGATSLLSSAYESALDEALRLKATTIAIPCISIGIYGFPGPQAADVAVSTVRRFLHTKAANVKLDVILCLYNATDEANYKAVLPLHFPIP